MTATLRDVARLAGVHPATASRAMDPTKSAMVNSATAKRVQKAAKQLGYVPNALARGLKTNSSLSIGAIVPDIANPLFPPIIRGVEDVVGAAGFNVLIANTDNELEREHAQIAGMMARKVDGFILASAVLDDPALAQLLADGVPVVLVNRVESGFRGSSVAGDDADGIEQAVRHLVELGHRRIAHIAGPTATSTGVVRRRAFEQAIASAGLDVSACPIETASAYAIDAGAEAFGRALGVPGGITAVIAANDLLALGCYDAIAAAGYACPADISVVGFNDMPLVDKVYPPLTTVRLHHYDLGAEAARVLLERLANPTIPPKSVLLPVSLVVRSSTARPR